MELPNRLYYRFKNAPDTLSVVSCARAELRDGHLIVEVQERLVLNVSELEFFDIRPNKKHCAT